MEEKSKDDFVKRMMGLYAEYCKKVEGKIKPPIPIKFRVRNPENHKIVAYETIEHDGIYRQEVLKDGKITDIVHCLQYFEGMREQFTGGFDEEDTEVYQRDIILLDKEFALLIGSGRLYCLVDIDNGGFKYGRADVDPFHMNTYICLALKYPDKIPQLESKAQCVVAGDVYNDIKLLEQTLL